ncbi:hypothetical protein GY21_14230 [Cryobacterium roopkundense]|uniref:CP family cyanate transporter-like MFS transporter n=1 Tax=Cryobacterium roopkundense TaxID=1001240 RepID=A0A099J516_9MICO|nr:MFS transporter [Cryobacterium roopkundense]KGJ72587.1 hypothetical protein GY21_14230 [Cryobacterium roopkundense]MBB5642892.1 CP family cyanate transporter-like MFS transporter [Cryobacterium roopkundense]
MNIRPFRWRFHAAVPVLGVIILIGLVLRGPIVAVAPIAATIRADTGLSSAGIGLLTSLPILLFAIATPFAAALIGRVGPNAATTICLLGVILGSIVRSTGGVTALFVGAALIGLFITIGNVVIPVLIRRDVDPRRVGFATGVYSSALNIGSMVTSFATAPLAEAWGWRVALLFWATFAVVATAGWMSSVGWRGGFVSGERPRLRMRDDRTGGMRMTARTDRPRLGGTAALLAIAFSGQAFAYYGTTAWLPQILHDEQGYSQTSAGSSASLFQIAALIGAMGIPALVARTNATWGVLAVFLGWLTIPLGLLLAPSLYLLWELIGGAAQGGGFTAVFIIVLRMATDDRHARRLSALVQGVGYGVACTAPSLLGAAHDFSDGWTVPIVLISLGVATFGSCGLIASRRQSRDLSSL